jgi:hypothetical protein
MSKMDQAQIEDARLTLENSGEVYNKWCLLNKQYSFRKSPVIYRNLIRDYLNKLYPTNDIHDRQRICNYLDGIWAKNGDRVPYIEEVEPIEKEIEMNKFAPSVEIKTITFLNNQDITQLSKEQLLDALVQVEADKARLSEVKTANKFLSSRQVQLTATLEKIKALLDKE